MKLVWKGCYKGQEYLPKGNLPENAVKYKEPKNTLILNIVAAAYSIPVIFFISIATALKLPKGVGFPSMFNSWGVLLAALMILPHEFLHASCFPKGAEVGIWVAPKSLLAFVHCVEPVSKNRFIFISLLPNIVFGLLPFIVWFIVPYDVPGNNILYSFACVSLLFGSGDYMNICNTLLQVPNGALTQLSGFHSYWFMDYNINTKIG
jgi:hypothetical protein